MMPYIKKYVGTNMIPEIAGKNSTTKKLAHELASRESKWLTALEKRIRNQSILHTLFAGLFQCMPLEKIHSNASTLCSTSN
jgi:hypothetical protein